MDSGGVPDAGSYPEVSANVKEYTKSTTRATTAIAYEREQSSRRGAA